MRTIFVIVASAVTLSGCGTVAKWRDLNQLDGALSAYRNCTALHKGSPDRCEPARAAYLASLSDAGRPRGIFTNWPAL